MTDEEQRQFFFDFLEEYKELAYEKIYEKYYKVHRSNLVNIIRAYKEELDKQKYTKKTSKDE
jgi:hypothetical protein